MPSVVATFGLAFLNEPGQSFSAMFLRQRWATQWPDRTVARYNASSDMSRVRAARDAIDGIPFLSWAISAGFAFPAGALEVLAYCESPGEASLIREFVSRDGAKVHANMAGWNGCLLSTQHPVYQYRVDLVVVRGQSRLAIEVDGLRFHGSQADFARDCLRQRRLTYAGYTVIRFTAKEAQASPSECWRQIDRILEKGAVHKPLALNYGTPESTVHCNDTGSAEAGGAEEGAGPEHARAGA